MASKNTNQDYLNEIQKMTQFCDNDDDNNKQLAQPAPHQDSQSSLSLFAVQQSRTIKALDLPIETIKANANTQLTMASGSSTVSFFSLSPEVRNMIYQLALVLPEDEAQHSLIPPALLRTSRKIRSEATTMFYTHNKFKIHIADGAKPDERVGVNMTWWKFDVIWAAWGGFNTTAVASNSVTNISVFYDVDPKHDGPEFSGQARHGVVGFQLSAQPCTMDDFNVYEMVKIWEQGDGVGVEDFIKVERLKLLGDDVGSHAVYELLLYQTRNFWCKICGRPDEVWPFGRLADMLLKTMVAFPLASSNVTFLCQELSIFMRSTNEGYWDLEDGVWVPESDSEDYDEQDSDSDGEQENEEESE